MVTKVFDVKPLRTTERICYTLKADFCFFLCKIGYDTIYQISRKLLLLKVGHITTNH